MISLLNQRCSFTGAKAQALARFQRWTRARHGSIWPLDATARTRTGRTGPRGKRWRHCFGSRLPRLRSARGDDGRTDGAGFHGAHKHLHFPTSRELTERRELSVAGCPSLGRSPPRHRRRLPPQLRTRTSSGVRRGMTSSSESIPGDVCGALPAAGRKLSHWNTAPRLTGSSGTNNISGKQTLTSERPRHLAPRGKSEFF